MCVYNNSIVFKNLHFEVDFQKFASSATQNTVVMWMNGQNSKFCFKFKTMLCAPSEVIILVFMR